MYGAGIVSVLLFCPYPVSNVHMLIAQQWAEYPMCCGYEQARSVEIEQVRQFVDGVSIRHGQQLLGTAVPATEIFALASNVTFAGNLRRLPAARSIRCLDRQTLVSVVIREDGTNRRRRCLV